jgi:hypothetical protein
MTMTHSHLSSMRVHLLPAPSPYPLLDQAGTPWRRRLFKELERIDLTVVVITLHRVDERKVSGVKSEEATRKRYVHATRM